MYPIPPDVEPDTMSYTNEVPTAVPSDFQRHSPMVVVAEKKRVSL